MGQKKVLMMTPELNSDGSITHQQIQGSLSDRYFFTGRVVNGLPVVNHCNITVMIHCRRFTSVVPTVMIHNWCCTDMSSSASNVQGEPSKLTRLFALRQKVITAILSMKLGKIYLRHVIFVICMFPLACFTHKSSMGPKFASDKISALKNAGIRNMHVTKHCEVHTKTIYHVIK